MKKLSLIKQIIYLRVIIGLFITSAFGSVDYYSDDVILNNVISVSKEMLEHLKLAAKKDPLKNEIEVVTSILSETLENQKILIYPNLFKNYKANAIAGESFILLDRQMWSDAFVKGEDIRSAVIEVLLEINGIQNIDMATTLYSLLPKMKTSKDQFLVKPLLHPFCLSAEYRYLLSSKINTNKGSWRRDAAEAKENALELCRNKGLFECKVADVNKLGIGRWATFKATYSGVSFSFTRNSPRRSACSIAKECELFYTYAPLGQLSVEDFYSIDMAIKECR